MGSRSERQNHPLTLELLEKTRDYFRTEKNRLMTAVHEAGHITYARRAGCTNMQFHGPMISWCPGGCKYCEGNRPFLLATGSVSYHAPKGLGAVNGLKISVAGIIFREVLTDTPNDKLATDWDIEKGKEWYDEVIQDNCFDMDLEEARSQVQNDLRSPAFRKIAWDTAREFANEVFSVN